MFWWLQAKTGGGGLQLLTGAHTSRGDQGHLMRGEHIVPQPEVMSAMLLGGQSMCCDAVGVTAPRVAHRLGPGPGRPRCSLGARAGGVGAGRKSDGMQR